jgi:hypothetical protein
MRTLNDGERRYLDLLKKVANNYVYLGADGEERAYCGDASPRYDDFKWQLPTECVPHSVLTRDQFDLLERLILLLDAEGVPGALMEAGVWRGGAVAFMAAMNEVLMLRREIIAADSFQGIPKSERIEGDPVDLWQDRWAAGLQDVRGSIARYGIDTAGIRFVEGFFKDSLPQLQVDAIALLRLDADSYESTMHILENLYSKVSAGGVILVDDCHLPGCVAALLEFRKSRAITSPMHEAGKNVYWVKSVNGN